jgi:CRP-like cAMP-binding protein
VNTLEKVLLLRQVGVFSALSGEELAEVAQLADEVERPGGEEVVRAGDVDAALHVIAEGRVAIVRDGKTQSVLSEREVFGELSLLDPAARVSSVGAVNDVTLLRIEADAVKALAREKPEVALGVAASAAKRLRAAGTG